MSIGDPTKVESCGVNIKKLAQSIPNEKLLLNRPFYISGLSPQEYNCTMLKMQPKYHLRRSPSLTTTDTHNTKNKYNEFIRYQSLIIRTYR